MNGASNSNPETYTVETATITLANPGTREGYTFTGWTCGGDAITQITLGSTGDKTITANWSANTYNLTYEGLEGATNSNPASYTIESEFNLANPGAREGWNFTGWTCGGEAITSIALGTIGDKTITATWRQIFVLKDGYGKDDDYYGTYNAKKNEGNKLDVRYERTFTKDRWCVSSYDES